MKMILKTLILSAVLMTGIARAADEVAYVDLQEVFKAHGFSGGSTQL